MGKNHTYTSKLLVGNRLLSPLVVVKKEPTTATPPVAWTISGFTPFNLAYLDMIRTEG